MSDAREYVPYPYIDTDDFPDDLLAKRDFSLREAAGGCEPGRTFDLQPVQQFVSRFISPLTTYRSMLLYHGTGAGKSCSAVQIAEAMHGARNSRRTLVIVPATIQAGFQDNVYDAARIPLRADGTVDAAAGSRLQCTGSAYYSAEYDGQSRRAVRRAARAAINRRYEFMGHDKFANRVNGIVTRVRREFAGVPEYKREREVEAVLRAAFDDRLIVVDEAHALRQGGTGEKESYARLAQVLSTCTSCRLVLLTATPMYDRATEIVDIVNLMLTNERLPLLHASAVFDEEGTLRPGESGEGALRAALRGRVSAMTFEDPDAFPASLYPSEIGKPGDAWKPPTRTADGTLIPPDRRLRPDGEVELFCTRMSATQARGLEDFADRTAGGGIVAHRWNNIALGQRAGAGSREAFFEAFRSVASSPGAGAGAGAGEPGSQLRVRYRGDDRILSKERCPETAPKLAKAADLVASARGVCFVFSNYVWSGVYPLAIALEERGFAPFAGRTLLADARPAADAPRYLMITKEADEEAGMSTADKVAAASDPNSGVRVVLGTEAAAQGLDFKAIREVHVLDSWWNMSRIRQVIGRAIRRCSHARLPPEERNTTVYLHCLTPRPGDATETEDQRRHRIAIGKARNVAAVERLLAEVALDCDLYELKPPPSGRVVMRSSQGAKVEVDRVTFARPSCDVKWPKRADRTDASTVRPYMYAAMLDLLAWDVADVLRTRQLATFEDIAAAVRADDVLLSLTLDRLMNHITSWRWIPGQCVVYRSGLYVLVPLRMRDHRFTLAEIRAGFEFGGAPAASLTKALAQRPD